MSKRLFVFIVIVAALASMLGLAIYYFSAGQEYYAKHQPVSPAQQPRFLYPIKGGGGSRLTAPLGVRVVGGQVYMTSGAGDLLITNREGRKLRSLRVGDSSTQQLSLRQIAVDEAGRVYVSAGPVNRIFVYDRRGQLVDAELGAASISNPVGLAWASGNLYVTDVGDHSVKILTAAGEQVRKIGGPGSGQGRFLYPNGVTVGKDGTIYIADSNNSRVQIFTADGQFLRILPQPPDRREKMLLPRSVAIDKLGRIHVVDTLRSRVLVYSSGHEFLFSYGMKTQGGGRLAFPNSIDIDGSTGLIFIADRKNERIAVWAGN